MVSISFIRSLIKACISVRYIPVYHYFVEIVRVPNLQSRYYLFQIRNTSLSKPKEYTTCNAYNFSFFAKVRINPLRRPRRSKGYACHFPRMYNGTSW